MKMKNSHKVSATIDRQNGFKPPLMLEDTFMQTLKMVIEAVVPLLITYLLKSKQHAKKS